MLGTLERDVHEKIEDQRSVIENDVGLVLLILAAAAVSRCAPQVTGQDGNKSPR